MQSLLEHRRLLRELSPLAASPSARLAGRATDRRTSAARDRSSNSTVVATSGTSIKEPDSEKVPPAPSEAVLEDPFLVVFPPDAHDNPRAWTLSKRISTFSLVTALAFFVGSASSINSAATVQAAAGLGVSQELMGLDTACFLTAFGLSSPIFGALSELGGRSHIYMGTLTLFILFEVGTALSQNLWSRCILRFLAGFFASCPLTIAGGSLADLTSPREQTVWFVIFSLFAFLGPVMAPMAGGYIAMNLGYRWCDWLQVAWGSGLLLITAMFLPETFAPSLLERRAKVMRELSGDDRYETELARTRTIPFSAVFRETIERPFKMLVYEPIVMAFSLYISMVYVVLFGDLVAFGIVFGPRGLNSGQQGLTFASIAIGLCIVAAFTPIIYKSYLKAERKEREATGNPDATPAPEERLRVAMIGGWGMPISLFWFAWTCDSPVPIWASLASQIFFGIGVLSCYMGSSQYIIDSYLSTAASAMSLLALLRYPVAASAIMFVTPMFDTLGHHWALMLLACTSLVVSFIPWILFYQGKKIRSWSRYTQS